jgi:hypothetical protein
MESIMLTAVIQLLTETVDDDILSEIADNATIWANDPAGSDIEHEAWKKLAEGITTYLTSVQEEVE